MSLWSNIQRFFGKRRKPKRTFPKWCAAKCYGALNEMKRAIQSKGVKLKDHDINLEVVLGVKRPGGWGWYEQHPEWPNGGMWVGALTASHGKLIEIAIDPAQDGNPNALHYGSLQHEMGHHWLITNGHGGGHDARYDDVIPGWREARKAVGY